MGFLSESYKIRIQELSGIVPKKIYYNSHGHSIPFYEFVEIEVEDRGNYKLKEVNRWKAKYKIADDAPVIWVTPSKIMAQSYMASADKYYDLISAKSEEEAEKILRQDLGADANIEPVVFTEDDGIIIPESDDGQNGFLMVLHKRGIEKQSLFEAIQFTTQDLSQAYDKSWQRMQGFDLGLIKQAIREGRAIGISYKSTDMPVTKFRLILPVTVGTYKTKSGVPLKLSAFHLAGQSERAAQKTGKRSEEPQYVWRLFDLDPKSFKSMWFSEKFFYEYPPGYKKGDKRFSSIATQYDVKTAEVERDAREGRGEKPGEPIDLRGIKPTGQVPAEAPENQKTPETPETQAPEAGVEQPLTEKERKALYLRKPWNKFLRDGFKFE